MSKFHINNKGIPAICKAVKGNCPFGSEDSHFESIEKAQLAIDNQNTENYGYLPKINKYEILSQGEISQELSDYIKQIDEPNKQAKDYSAFQEKALEHSNFDDFSRSYASEIVKSEIFKGEDIAKSALVMWKQIHMDNSSKNLHKISDEEAIQVIQDNIQASYLTGWFREYNSDYKPKIEQAIMTNPELRNASLNISHQVYQESTGNQVDFNEFLEMDIDVYRGGNFKFVDSDVFVSYSFDNKIANKFTTRDKQEILTRKIKVKDTLGSLQTTGEAEIMVPRTTDY